jgi:hypothetical protein
MSNSYNIDQQGQSVKGPQTNIGETHGPVYSGTTTIYKSPPPRIPLQKPPRPLHFIGREKELDYLMENLQPGRVITLCGPGGIGKTALAAETIWRLAPGNDPPERFPDGIVFHSFYGYPQASIALEAIACAYREELRPNPIEAARRALANRHALIILDGAEAADHMEEILSVSGSCGVLITTRRHRDAPLDWKDLPPLQLDQSMKLLKACGRESADAEDAIIRKICELMGGLPLAIFLAGRYIAQRRQRATDFLAWLEASPLSALDLGKCQHESVPLLMEKSLAQVGDRSRTALGVLGMMAMRPFDSKPIAFALEVEPMEADRYLGELLDYGLLSRPDSCYQVSHALVHIYARKRLKPTRQIMVRLVEYYCSIIRELKISGQMGRSWRHSPRYSSLDIHRAHIQSVQSACRDVHEWGAGLSLSCAIADCFSSNGQVTMIEPDLFGSLDDIASWNEREFLASLCIAYWNLTKYTPKIRSNQLGLGVSSKIDGKGNKKDSK